MRATSPSLASHDTTRESIAASCGNPSRHGTHFPHVCAADACRNDSSNARGHVPGGTVRTRREKRSATAATPASSRARGAIDSLVNVSSTLIERTPPYSSASACPFARALGEPTRSARTGKIIVPMFFFSQVPQKGQARKILRI